MVAIHEIPLSKSDLGPVLAAVALPLSGPSGRDCVHRFQAEGWEVELQRGGRHVVARSAHPLVGDALLDAAIEFAHRALDLSSVRAGDHLLTKMPVDNHIALEGMNGRQVVRYRSAARDVVLEVEATGTVGPAGPGSAAPNVTPPHKWTPAFRFYRLSQSSRDHFEAYRNLFLGLEALLDQLFRKRSNEREKAWLCRSVRAAGAKIDLQRLATPEIADPANDIVDRLWNIRCKLFHAKTGKALIPDERVSYTDVADAYPLLLALWTEIAHSWLGPIRRGASFSRSLRLAMLEAWACSSRFGVTSDATPPPNRGEWPAVLPDSPVSMFSRPTSIIEGPRGCMALSSSTEVSDLPAGQVVARILAVGDDGRPKMSDSIAGGLTLDGADIFETVWTFGPLLARYGQRTGFPGM